MVRKEKTKKKKDVTPSVERERPTCFSTSEDRDEDRQVEWKMGGVPLAGSKEE